MTEVKFDRASLRALADEGNETALDRLADLADARGDVDELNELLDEGSMHAGSLLTRRAVATRDLAELQRISDAGCDEAGVELERLLAGNSGADTRITRINPGKLHVPPGYHHVTVVEAGRTAYLAGQCPVDVDGALVGAGDLDAQIDQVVANAMTALAAVGAEPGDVVRSVVYVVSDDTTVLAAAWRRLTGSVIAPAFTTASTLLGVAQLGFAGQLVEVDLTAALSAA